MPFIPFGKNANGIFSTLSTGGFRVAYAVYPNTLHIPRLIHGTYMDMMAPTNDPPPLATHLTR